MRKFIITGGSWGEGYQHGTIISAEDHAMTDRLAKGEVKVADMASVILERMNEEDKKKEEEKKEKIKNKTKKTAFKCEKCGRYFKSNAGLATHLKSCKGE